VVRKVVAALAAAAFVALVPSVEAQTETVKTAPRPVQIARPDGYMGIVYSGNRRVQASVHRKDGEVVEQRILVSYVAYPAIVSVEPGSPAARAGLSAGDTVLSYNGYDVVKQPFPLYDMLKPGERINLRVRRNGRVRNVAVTVGRRPASRATVLTVPYEASPEVAEHVRREVERARDIARRELEMNRELTDAQRAELERLTREAVVARAAATAGAARPGAAPTPPVPPAPPTPVVFTAANLSGVAGAEMTPMNDDLADLVGMRRGVFIVKVNPGTPAEQSGLRGGDVIISVGDSAVSDVAQVRRAINAEQRRIRIAGGAREIPIEIVRKHRKQKVVLRF
jgi:membrane-associated protease RseP (regulator of RpoE activity)